MNNKKPLSLAMTLALGGLGVPLQSSAATLMEFSWQGVFTFLAPDGAALANTSLSAKTSNQYLTPASGTLTYVVETGALNASMDSFHWGSNNPTQPFTVTDIGLQPIGDGMGGSGPLVLGNMLFDWNGTNGIPVSMVLDASGFFSWLPGAALGGNLSGVGATPSIDGTYVGPVADITYSNGGYLQLGPTPIATTDWNTTPLCDNNGAYGACFHTMPSGALPLVADTAINGYRYDLGTPMVGDYLNGGVGIGGSPMIDGPFPGYSLGFDFTSITYESLLVVEDCPPICDDPSEVPLPAAFWLFGSGLVGLGLTGTRRAAGRARAGR